MIPQKAKQKEVFPELKPLYGVMNDGKMVRLCGPIAVGREFANIDLKERGLEINHRSVLGTPATTILFRRDLSACRKVAGILAASGVDVSHKAPAQEELCRVLAAIKPEHIVLHAPREGLHEIPEGEQPTLVWTTGDRTYGRLVTSELEVELEPNALKITSTKGDIEQWNREVVGQARGNNMLVFALCLPFAAPLLSLCRLPGFIVAFWEETTSGKSTLLRGAQSVFRDPTDLATWKGTESGFGAYAAAHTDHALILDNLDWPEVKNLPDVVYSLTNQAGKLRAKQDGRLATHAFARIIAITAAEKNPVDLAQKATGSLTDGFLVRFLPIRVRRKYRAFDDIHGAEDGGAFAKKVVSAACTNYGWPWRKFIKYLMTHISEVKEEVLTANSRIARKLVEMVDSGDATALVPRVAEHFALIYRAGRIAAKAGALALTKTELREAVVDAFRTWHQGFRDNYARIGEDPVAFVRRAVKDIPSAKIVPLNDWKKHTPDTVIAYRHRLNGENVLLVHKRAFDKLFTGRHARKRVVAALRTANILIIDSRDSGTKQFRMPKSNDRERFFTLRLDDLKANSSA